MRIVPASRSRCRCAIFRRSRGGAIFAARAADACSLLARGNGACARCGWKPGDLDDGASAWAEQRRRIDAGESQVAIVGDSRILFDTDLDRFEALTGVRPVQLALAGTNARPFLEQLAADSDFDGLAIVGIADRSYFRDDIGLMADALDVYRYESPSRRSGHVLQRAA